MIRAAAFVYRLAAGLLFGAQLFFAAVAAQAAFPREVAALPRADPLRAAAADLVGKMLGALDRWTLALTALCVLCAVLLWQRGVARALRAALPPLLAGLCAASSTLLFTPWIHRLREAGETGTPAFGRLHGLSSGVLLLEILLLGLSVWLAPAGPEGSSGER